MAGTYYALGVPPFATADGTALTAAATLTEISPLPQKQTPANWIGEYAGKTFRFEAWGHYTLGATASNVTFSIVTGTIGQAIGSAAVIASTATVAQVTSSTNRPWRMEADLQVRSIGSSGSIIGIMDFSNVTSGGKDLGMTAAGSAVTIDTTVARYWALAATLSSATGNSLTCRQFLMVSDN